MGINFDNLNREGCMGSMQQQLGILGTIWHLLKDCEKPPKKKKPKENLCVDARSPDLLTSGQQSGF